MSKKIDRRDFLKGSLSIGLGAAAVGAGLGSLAHLAGARAATSEEQHYVFCYFGGGWDVLLSLDPLLVAVGDPTSL